MCDKRFDLSNREKSPPRKLLLKLYDKGWNWLYVNKNMTYINTVFTLKKKQ